MTPDYEPPYPPVFAEIANARLAGILAYLEEMRLGVTALDGDAARQAAGRMAEFIDSTIIPRTSTYGGWVWGVRNRRLAKAERRLWTSLTNVVVALREFAESPPLIPTPAEAATWPAFYSPASPWHRAAQLANAVYAYASGKGAVFDLYGLSEQETVCLILGKAARRDDGTPYTARDLATMAGCSHMTILRRLWSAERKCRRPNALGRLWAEFDCLVAGAEAQDAGLTVYFWRNHRKHLLNTNDPEFVAAGMGEGSVRECLDHKTQSEVGVRTIPWHIPTNPPGLQWGYRDRASRWDTHNPGIPDGPPDPE
jgi:hypothetical protein